MKTAKHNSMIALVAVSFALLFFGSVSSLAADATTSLSTKELKVLLKNVKTPAEHRTIATYYRQRAEAFSKSSKEHFESAELRAKNPAFPALEANMAMHLASGRAIAGSGEVRMQSSQRKQPPWLYCTKTWQQRPSFNRPTA
jgi:hypothetical protein